jgi:FdrA protein
MSDEKKQPQSLLQSPVQVVNVGLEGFARDLESHGATVVHVEWSPPARGDVRLADLLSKLGG